VIRILSDENVHADIVSGLQQEGFDLVTAAGAGLAGRKDIDILDYSEKQNLLLISGDKDFGGLIEFGRLWGRGRVLLLRYQIINVRKIVEDIAVTLRGESELLSQPGSFVIVLSESGYRVRRPNP
jgi:predicted nuclease of predicted toxin-antitoxin system